MLAGIEEACRRNHINLLYATMTVDSNNVPVEMPRLLEESEVDGLLLVGAFVGPALDEVLHAKQLPVVLVDAYAERNGYDAVLSENPTGAYCAVEHLIERGHRHIAFVGSHPNAYQSLRQRRDAYERALGAHGIAARYFADSNLDREDVMRATVALLEENPQVTALFGCNDAVAIAAMNLAQSIGRSVPDTLSVIGFDDIDLAQNAMPPLTTMRVDKIGMGRMAVQLARYRLQFPDAERVTTFVQAHLVERESVSTHLNTP